MEDNMDKTEINKLIEKFYQWDELTPQEKQICLELDEANDVLKNILEERKKNARESDNGSETIRG
jgi:phosphomevalonate kinase